jgi:hypothetical protein
MLDWSEGRLDPASWSVRIDGIEAFDYESPLHGWVYDSITRADVLDVATGISGYELVIMSDVIEHIEKGRALDLLAQLLATNRNVLVSTPTTFFEQEIAGNPYERHVSKWALADFCRFPYDAEIAGGAALVVLLAGAGSIHPSVRAQRVNRAVDRVPGIRSRGLLRRMVKLPFR